MWCLCEWLCVCVYVWVCVYVCVWLTWSVSIHSVTDCVWVCVCVSDWLCVCWTHMIGVGIHSVTDCLPEPPPLHWWNFSFSYENHSFSVQLVFWMCSLPSNMIGQTTKTHTTKQTQIMYITKGYFCLTAINLGFNFFSSIDLLSNGFNPSSTLGLCGSNNFTEMECNYCLQTCSLGALDLGSWETSDE